jgi:nucleoside-diphosphate-sugar epimerase
MKRFLVTGATGFIGRLLCAHLLDENWGVRGTIQVSKDQTTLIPGVEPAVIEPIDSGTQWRNALAGIDTIIHLAARVHIMNDISSDPLIEFRRVNTEGTKRLANEAVRTGVKRMVFVSSIKVNGEEASEPYKQNSPPNPSGPYSISKWEAELCLRQIEAETGLEVVVVRPTLVYGPGVKANFLHMMKIIQRGIPLPLASITNKRSLIYSGNFVNALTICAVHPAAAGKTYLVSDGEDVSTPDLIRRVANALGKPARLVRMSPKLLRLAGILTGRSAEVSRITGSLTVDSSNIRRELDWKQPFTMEEGLHETADWFKKNLSI